MSTITGFVFLFFLGSCIHQSSQTAVAFTRCAHHHHCPESQCCVGYDDTMYGWGNPRPGTCHDYTAEGQSCEFFDYFGCGCLPGLQCLPADGSPETYRLHVDNVCTNVSTNVGTNVGTNVRPASGALCNEDSDCPTSGECCSQSFGSTSYFTLWEPQYRGKCNKCQ